MAQVPGWVRWICFRRVGMSVCLVACVICLSGLVFLETDNGIDRWLCHSEDTTQSYREFESVFGQADFLLLLVEGTEKDWPSIHQKLMPLTNELAHLTPPLVLVDPLSLAPAAFPTASGGSASSNPLLQLLINPRQDGYGVLIIPSEGTISRAHVRLLRDRLTGVLPEEGWHLGGPAAFNDAIAELGETNQARFIPMVTLLIGIGILVLFRSWKPALVAMASVGLCVGGTFGLAGWIGEKSDLVSSSLPPLLTVMTVAHTIHLLKSAHSGGNPLSFYSYVHAVHATWRPSFLAAITTAIGFIPFAWSDIPALATIGVLAPFGVMVGWVTAYAVPGLVVQLGMGGVGSSQKVQAVDQFQAIPLTRHDSDRKSRLVLLGAAVVIAVSLPPIPSLGFDSDPLKFFAEDHRLAIAYREIESRLMGLSAVEFMVSGSPESFLAGVARLRSDESIPPILATTDFPREGNPSPMSPLSRHYNDPSGRFLRLTVFAPTSGSAAYRSYLEGLEKTVADQLSPAQVVQVTGVAPLIVESQDTLIRTQFRGLASSLVLIAGVTWFLLRSFPQTILTLIPNVAPVAVLLGAIGWSGTSLDVGMVMVANVTLGIAMDDTYHFLGGWDRARRKGLSRHEATVWVRRELGPAILGTTMVNSVGFFALAISPFPPMRSFGLWVGAGLWVALVADWLLLPALLVWFRPRVRWRG